MGGYETVPDDFPDRNEYLSMFCETFHTILQVFSSYVQIRSEGINETVQGLPVMWASSILRPQEETLQVYMEKFSILRESNVGLMR